MPEQVEEQAEDMIVRNLIEAVECLHRDLDRVELWTAALGHFHRPVPDYHPGDQYLLPTLKRDTQQPRR